ncbi:tyrosine-protein phosphatase [Gorillibacterium massiliense]|uniref:tyrosine-protein phosphatase n=1 Tax=Gorillibacterium massiliense TaxID=1280390 RepID=UPI0004BAE50A|nr:CpsB/CapC family capsule biosynthesis tyrosine phosphatase [Gorillibacterium massiliense]
MFDIHTHILPGVDDGAQNLDESLDLARAAVAEGITGLIATPHHQNGRYWNDAAFVTAAVSVLQEIFREKEIPLNLQAGQEIRVYPELLDDLAAGKLLTLGNSPYLLIEFPTANVPHYVSELFYELCLLGKIPVIAHPERNTELANHPDRLKKLIDLGAYAQVTSHSINGGFGRTVQTISLKMLRSNLVHLVSSDAHHIDMRHFALQEAYWRVQKELGREKCQHMKNNAEKIGMGEHMSKFWEEPVASRKTFFSFFRSKSL